MKREREYLFRGKREDNGEWVEGRLIGEDVIVPVNQEFEVEAHKIYGCDLTAYIVLRETVGQYAEITDKNGRKIFEGDVVKVQCGECYDGHYELDQKILVKNITDGVCTYLKKFSADNITIIGNTHDFKEKVKKEKKV